MRTAHFELKTKPDGNVEPGIWLTEVMIQGKQELIPIDLIVPGAPEHKEAGVVHVSGRTETKPPGAFLGSKLCWQTTLRC
jgi:hypothetical protein